MAPYVHPTAIVEPGVKLGEDCKVWHFCHLRTGAEIGPKVNLGKDVFVDSGVAIGQGSRIQNGVSIYNGVNISQYCFIGPHVIFTNDQFPRAGNKAWKLVKTDLAEGCSIGAGAVIRCGIRLGYFSMVGAGAIVSKSVKDFELVMGIPARPVRRVCACGQAKLTMKTKLKDLVRPCCRENLDYEMYKLALQCQKELMKKS